MSTILGSLTALGAGVLTFFTPCIFPLILPYICFIAGVSSQEISAADKISGAKKRLILTEAILFILGFSLVFVILGASASFLGAKLIAHQRLIRIIGGAVVILFGLHMLGVLKIKFLQSEKKFHFKNRPVTWFGSVLIGMAFAFCWTPCASPILGGILMMAATGESVIRGVVLLSLYSLGVAIPLLLLSIGIKKGLNMLTKIQRHLRLVSLISGALLIILGSAMILPAVWAGAPVEEKAGTEQKAADFSLSAIDGGTIRLSDYKGKVIILNFWATYCPPCRKEIPDFIKLYNRYKDRGLMVIGINLDKPDLEELKRFSKGMGINYPIVKNDALTSSRYGVRYIPATFIIDKRMNIVKDFVGYNPASVFESEIKELLKK
jgi:cytochrome c-type biogenesis protein